MSVERCGATHHKTTSQTQVQTLPHRAPDERFAYVQANLRAGQSSEGILGRTLLIRLGYSLVPLRQRMEQFFTLLVIALPITLALASFAGQAIARRALQPLGDSARGSVAMLAEMRSLAIVIAEASARGNGSRNKLLRVPLREEA